MFVRQNNEFTHTASDLEAIKELPLGNYLLKFSQVKGYYLEMTSEFKFPSKLYGDAEKLSKRYLNTFNNIDGNLGILFSGTKGTGKSVTAKLTAGNSGLPVIIITEPFNDENFKSFLSNITQKSVIFVDEFEKVYHDPNLQNDFLSILDGVFEGKKLFLFTSNEKSRINQYMLNRPGRIHYLSEYDSLDESIIEDVIEDNLNNKEHRTGLLEVLNILGTITMDVLISIIREMNMYEEDAREAVRYLNLKPESSMYKCEVFQGSKRLGDTIVHSHPLTHEELDVEFLCDDIRGYVFPEGEEDEAMEDEEGFEVKSIDAPSREKEIVSRWLYLTIDMEESRVRTKGKKIIIESDNDMRYIFTKKKSYQFTF